MGLSRSQGALVIYLALFYRLCIAWHLVNTPRERKHKYGSVFVLEKTLSNLSMYANHVFDKNGAKHI
jgi:hypothetical protein